MENVFMTTIFMLTTNSQSLCTLSPRVTLPNRYVTPGCKKSMGLLVRFGSMRYRTSTLRLST